MFKTALFILTQPVNHIRKCLPLYMKEINKLTSKTAYIHIQPGTSLNDQLNENRTSDSCDTQFEILRVPFTDEIRNLVKELYVSNANICSNLDVRILVGHIGNSELTFKKYNFKEPCDIVLFDDKYQEDISESTLLKSISKSFNINESGRCQTLDIGDSECKPKKQKVDDSANKEVCIDINLSLVHIVTCKAQKPCQ